MSKYEFGKRWDDKLPRYDLKWFMGRVHVGTPDSEVEADIRRRCAAWPPRMIGQAVAYALECHKANQGLYRYVMGGSYRRYEVL
jgi:hypothetical protein